MGSKLFIPNDVLETIVCLNCNNYLSVFPIYTKTDNSGALCGRCKLTEEEKYIRDEAYECIAQFLVFPCQYFINGCKDNLTPSKLEPHEHCCQYKKYECPSKEYLKCQWKGSRADLVKHFQQKHSSSLLKDSSFELNFVQSQEEYLLLQQADELFLLKKEVDSRKAIFSCSVEHLRASEDSESFNYFLKVENCNRNYFYKCPEKSTCDNIRLNSTQLTADMLRERLQEPVSMIVNININKARPVEMGSSSGADGYESEKNFDVMKMPDINWDILSELECPICYDYMLPPIYQCINGHSICGICKNKVSNACPMCKVAIEETKNFVLEKMTQHLVYPCKFHKTGCQYADKSTIIENHEDRCEFGPYSCPLKEKTKCDWKARHAEVTEHIDTKHNEFILGGDKVDLPFDKSNFIDVEEIFLVKYLKKMFKLLYRFENAKFYWCVQFVGPASESRTYKFEIDVVDLSNSKRRCYFTGLVVPLSDHNECFSRLGQYIMAPLEQLEPFITTAFSFRIRVIKD